MAGIDRFNLNASIRNNLHDLDESLPVVITDGAWGAFWNIADITTTTVGGRRVILIERGERIMRTSS